MTVTILNLEPLKKKLDMLEKPERPIAKGLDNYLKDVEKAVIPYPPISEANRPPGPNNYSWYVRNFGVRTRTGKAYAVSQNMSKEWDFETRVIGAKIRATIKNKADYSKYVQGLRQTGFHKSRGWKRVDEHIDKTSDDAVNEIRKEIDKELRR